MKPRCCVCKNEYESLIEITHDGQTDLFDCFECAIHKLAPKCESCGVAIIGHGIQVEESIYCSSHCARTERKSQFYDRMAADLMMDF